MQLRPPTSTLFPYTTLFRSTRTRRVYETKMGRFFRSMASWYRNERLVSGKRQGRKNCFAYRKERKLPRSSAKRDRKSTRLNSSHRCISYAVFCLKKKNNKP